MTFPIVCIRKEKRKKHVCHSENMCLCKFQIKPLIIFFLFQLSCFQYPLWCTFCRRKKNNLSLFWKIKSGTNMMTQLCKICKINCNKFLHFFFKLQTKNKNQIFANIVIHSYKLFSLIVIFPSLFYTFWLEKNKWKRKLRFCRNFHT